MTLRLKLTVLPLFLILLSFAQSVGVAHADVEVWRKLKDGGHVALIRHALAPGTGDPTNFDVTKCETQRNLNDTGRDQARGIGERFRDNGISDAAVYSSQWCRCMETAELLGVGDVTPLPLINSFFQRYEKRAPQTEAAKAWIAAADLSRPTVLVTHQVNISALTDVYPASGEIIVVKRGEGGTLEVAGRIRTD